MKPVDIDLVAQHAIDTIWGKSAISTADGADVLAAKDGGTTEKTMTLTTLKTYIAGAIYSSGLTLATLDSAAALAGADLLLLNQSGTPKRTTLAAVNAAIYAALNAYVTALTANTSPADTDVFYVIQGGVEKKVTLLSLKGVFGSVIAPASTTENKIPQWASGQKTLKDGLTIQTAVRAVASAVDTAVPTEQAVREMMNEGLFPVGGDTGDVAIRIGAVVGEGLETVVVDKIVLLGTVAGVSVFTIPGGVILRSVQASIWTAATAGGTSVAVGLGTDADPDLYGKTSALTANAKINTLLDYNILGAEVSLEAFPVTAGGSIGNAQFSAGTLRVRVVYDRLTSLADGVAEEF
jgi:hypothetical protein